MKALADWLLFLAALAVIVVPPTTAILYDWPWWVIAICWFPLAYLVGLGLALSFRWPWR